MTSARGEAASGREKGEDDVSWAEGNLSGSKMKKINTDDSADTNRW
jgi:hypothetical protein